MTDRLYHYIVVRRDLPVGVSHAQVAHAAGESFYLLAGRRSSEKERPVSNRQVEGLSPSDGSIPKPIVVVLGARSESKLKQLERQLFDADVQHVAVREPDAPFFGQLMAVGLMPGLKPELAPHVCEFHLYPESD